MANYVYSTLSCDNFYAVYDYKHANKDIPVVKHKILVKGGSNIINKNFVTPDGIRTEINDEDLGLLMEDTHFKEHMRLGFIKVEKRKLAPSIVAKNMEAKDNSAQKVEGDR
jgi:hypothetical protein